MFLLIPAQQVDGWPRLFWQSILIFLGSCLVSGTDPEKPLSLIGDLFDMFALEESENLSLESDSERADIAVSLRQSILFGAGLGFLELIVWIAALFMFGANKPELTYFDWGLTVLANVMGGITVAISLVIMGQRLSERLSLTEIAFFIAPFTLLFGNLLVMEEMINRYGHPLMTASFIACLLLSWGIVKFSQNYRRTL